MLGAAAAEGEWLRQSSRRGDAHVILHVEGAEQSVGENSQLSPGIDELGANVHEVKPIGQRRLDNGGLSVVQVGFQQVHPIDAQPGRVRPLGSELLNPFAARFGQHQDKCVDDITELGLLLPAP